MYADKNSSGNLVLEDSDEVLLRSLLKHLRSVESLEKKQEPKPLFAFR